MAFVACEDFNAVLRVLQTAKQELPDVLQAFEYLDRASLEMVREMNPDTMYPFDSDFDHYVLVEIAQTVNNSEETSSEEYGSSSDNEPTLDIDRLLSFLESIEDEIIVSCIIMINRETD